MNGKDKMKKIDSMMVAWENYHDSSFDWFLVDEFYPIRSVDSMIDAWKKNNGVEMPGQIPRIYTMPGHYVAKAATAASYSGSSSTSSTYTVWYD